MGLACLVPPQHETGGNIADIDPDLPEVVRIMAAGDAGGPDCQAPQKGGGPAAPVMLRNVQSLGGNERARCA